LDFELIKGPPKRSWRFGEERWLVAANLLAQQVNEQNKPERQSPASGSKRRRDLFFFFVPTIHRTSNR